MKIRFFNTKDSIGNWRVICCLLCAFALLLAVPFAARAQKTTADVRGAVTDEQGAAIAGAEVTITNVETSFSRTAVSGSDGEYNFPDLPLGHYRIHVTHAGFKGSEQTGIILHASDSLVLNIGLKVGAISESVTVEATPIAVETTNGELTGLIQASQVADLPLNGRNFMQLVTTVPGVAAGPQFSSLAKGLKGGSDLSISGGAVDSNLWLVDGASNNDVGSNRTILVFPSIDAIEEVKIERNSYGPEFGQSAGGQISMITKSGGNAFHGDVYYFGRNDKLNTFDTFVKSGCLASGKPCVKNELRRNDYGYTIGGPIKKDKIFFFWSQEWNKMIEGQTTTARVPTVAEKAGDFSAIRACPNAVSQLGWPSVTGSNPAVARDLQLPSGAPATTFSAPNVFSAGALSPAAQVILQAFPTPTNSDPCARNNFTKSFGVPTNWREENVRGDINLTKSLRAMMRYTGDSWQLGPPDGGFGWGNNNLGPIGEDWSQPGRIVVGRLSKTIGSSMVNDFTFSYSANRITINPAGTNPGLDQKLNDTIPSFYPLSGKLYGDKGPAVWINCCGLPSVWTIAPWQNQEDMYNWQDDFSMVKGRHTLKFGGLYSRNYKAEQAANGEFGTLGGSVGYNGNNGSTFQTLYGIADLEMLNMGMGWGETQTIFKVRNVWHNIEAYAADNFRVTPRLTVTYGVRWTFLGPVYLSDNKYTLFNPSAFQASLGNTPCNGLVYSPGLGANPCPAGTGGVAGPNNALMNPNYHGFAPRLGVAWDPTGQGKWSIRSGVGQFFNRDRLWPLQLAGSNPPFNGSFIGTGNNAGHNARFLDNTNQLPSCTPTCFGTGLGTPNTGQEFLNNVPNSWQWNFTVQRELFKDARLEVGYVGSKTLHWEAVTDINSVLPANRLTYAQNENDITRPASVAADLRPFGAAVGDNGIKYYTHASAASYHSLQSQFTSRMGNRANFQASYTYSKLLSDSQRIDTPAFNVDAYNLKSDWGPDILNHTHIFSASVVYHLPYLNDKSALERDVLGGWEVSPIISAATGPSITTFVSLGGTNKIGDPMGVGGGGATGRERGNRVSGQSCKANTGDVTQWLNPAVYTMNGYQLGKIGNAGAGICTGPGNGNVDLGFNKNFKVTERIKAQFRFEFFNLFNTPHYNYNDILNPTINFQNPRYGDASGNEVFPDANKTLVGATQILSANPSPGSYGKINSITENGYRQIQYALKFTF
jgi:hypothetical protein